MGLLDSESLTHAASGLIVDRFPLAKTRHPITYWPYACFNQIFSRRFNSSD